MSSFALGQGFLGTLDAFTAICSSLCLQWQLMIDSWVLVFSRGEQEQHHQLQPGIRHLFKRKQLPQLQQCSPA